MRVPARLALLLAVVAFAGCTAAPHRQPPFASMALETSDPAVTRCVELFRRTDEAVDAAGVRDGQTARIPGHPFLRADRWLARLARQPGSDPVAIRAWMRRLDARARAAELANLPATALGALASGAVGASPASLAGELDACGARLATLVGPDALARARVDDDYQTWKRWAGLYAFTRIPFSAGVRRYQRETEAVFATPLDALAPAGHLERYGPPAGSAPPDMRLDALASGEEPAFEPLAALAARHAPVFEIDTVSASDRIGQPRWAEGPRVSVDTTSPVMFVRLARTLFAGRVLPQIVYSVWFPERPRTGALDLLGGNLDGITWRVTLDLDGQPLAYDTIHNCGCYHQFFPTPRVRPRPGAGGLDEGAFIPQHLPAVTGEDRVVLRIAAGTHALQRVSVVPRDAATHREVWLEQDDTLRSLSWPGGGRRSLFDADGIVPGSERGERWLFWPMGVREPGAMRQWGRHATAFVGRRHFDDPDLIDRYFEPAR